MARIRILIVDDEPEMLENCERLLRPEGYDVHILDSSLAFRQTAHELRPDIILSDLRMPGADGMTVLAAAVADDPQRPVLLMTAHATVASAVAAIREGAFDYITKPFTADQLVVAVERAARFRRLTVENRTLLKEIERRSDSGILSGSPVMQRLLEQAHRVAPTDANLLVTGESGTGKELMARLVHYHSARATAPFVPVDCAALPEGLLESELFGHEKGAFTGAVARRDGLIAEANGGTLFLDEVGEMSMLLQAKLLRVLEQREIRRLGNVRLVPVDIRVIAATNRDLGAAVNGGTFREDLYYRLNVVQLELPPLRAREGDVSLLLRTFIDEFAQAAGRASPTLATAAWEALVAHRWPGNVRELRNVAQRMVVLDDDGVITLHDLPESIRRPAGLAAAPADENIPLASYEFALQRVVRSFQAQYLHRLLEIHGGNISRAAVTAGVSRRTVHRWLAEHQIASPAETQT